MIAPCKEADNTSVKQTTLETPRLILRAAQPSDAVPLHEAFKDPEVMRYWYVDSCVPNQVNFIDLGSTPPHTSLETTTKWLTSMINSTQNGITDFIITLKQQFPSPSSSTDGDISLTAISKSTEFTTPTPLPIGKIGIYRAPPSNEIGFLIARPYWGCGLAKEAQGCILDYLFSLERGSDSESQSQAHSPSTPSDPLNPTPHSYTTLSPADQSSPWLYPSISADVDPRNAASIGILKHMGFVETGYVERTDCIGGEWVDSVYYGLRRERWVGRKDKF